jgi:hypothetical protein
MMTESVTAGWLFTAVFAVAALLAVLPRPEQAGPAQRVDWPAAMLCVVMCMALIAMTWRSESPVAVWVQVVGFGCAALRFGLAGRSSSGRLGRSRLRGLHHATMAVVMMWMLTAWPGAAGMRPTGPGHGAMAVMSLVVNALAVVYCGTAAVPWLGKVIGPGLRVEDPEAAGQGVMCAGMAAMLIGML